MPLTFIGFRGCGKTTLGAAVARRLGWRFVDADVEIERRTGRTIRDIFASEGEPYFRALERQVMADLLAQDDLVIAAGGGAVLSPATRSRLRGSGPVIYLRISPETAHRRITGDATTAERRPALTDLAPLDEITSVMQAREPLYRECARHVFDADSDGIETLTTAILKTLASIERQETAT